MSPLILPTFRAPAGANGHENLAALVCGSQHTPTRLIFRLISTIRRRHSIIRSWYPELQIR
jgi:hypothetical protein